MNRARAALGLAVVLVLASPLEAALALRIGARTPKEPDWDAARPAVLELLADADGVVVAPRWAEPHARRAFGDGAFPLHVVARADESRLRRVVEVSVDGARLPELAAFREVSSRALAGGLVARVLEHPSPARVVTDFTALVDRGAAEVSMTYGEAVMRCAWGESWPVVAPGLFGHPTLPARRYRCGARPFLSVGVTVHEDERWLARRCVWSHPPEGGKTRIVFRDVPLGAEVRGHLSLHWTLERESHGAPVRLAVVADGARLGLETHHDGEGWKVFSFSTGALAGKTSREMVFEIDADSANERHVCWEADSR